MLSLQLEEFMVELKDGSIKNVGPTNKSATAKLYDVEGVDVREFGDERVKLAFEDEAGNEIEIALFPDEAREIARGIEMLEEESRVFE
ncbi:hypothetical protein BV210_16315 [Halorientalis sp. IM1011]|uniref:hypothetical protein n=1 Tax=Halorientalis sp. IM1011 TaxID=1932360 RepID=UPI00097CC4C4|nr:hypothetical protein [Halorientalis sp. IM1011]AQL44176.1 hypothetical protein BV210_16315 [Halorientalis sp. IM1011]